MSVLKKYFDKNLNQSSPVQVDYERVVKHDEDGNEFITYVPVDYKKIVASHGKVSDWSLENLLKAGINPDFPIHTGINTRLDGIDQIRDAEAWVDALLSETGSKEDIQ